MDGILIRERYKVIQVLEHTGDYAAVQAVDIQDRETPTRLINLYGGPLLHRYGEAFSRVTDRDCPELCGIFLEEGALAAVFLPGRGTPIDRLFYRGDRWTWPERMELAQLVMHRALTLAALPPDISCGALCSHNLLIDPVERAVSLRFLIRPMEEMTARELPLLAADQLKKILPRRWSSCDRQLEMLARLEWGDFPSIVPMYAWWREELEGMRADFEALSGRNFISRQAVLLWKNIRRSMRGRGARQ